MRDSFYKLNSQIGVERLQKCDTSRRLIPDSVDTEPYEILLYLLSTPCRCEVRR